MKSALGFDCSENCSYYRVFRSVIELNNPSEKLSTSLFILMSSLFVFSMLSIAFSFNSLLKDIVYSLGFLIAIGLIIFFRKQAKHDKE